MQSGGNVVVISYHALITAKIVTGVKYHVKNTNGGLLGGTKTREQAEAMKARWEQEYKTNPWAKGVKVYIEEV